MNLSRTISLLAICSLSLSACVIDRTLLASALGGNSDTRATTTARSSKPGTINPVISSLTSSPATVARPGQAISVQISAYDPEGENLRYNWSSTGGTLSATSGTLITWKAPDTPGTYTIQVIVTNDSGGGAGSSLNVTVSDDGTANIGPAKSLPMASTPKPEQGPETIPGGFPPQTPETLPVSTITPGIAFNDFTFVTFASGWVVGGKSGSGQIRHTTDGGATWTNQDIGPYELRAVFFKTETTGWVGGKSGSMYKTTNGGADWVKLDLGHAGTITGLYFKDFVNGFAVAKSSSPSALEPEGGLYSTADGGATWIRLQKGEFDWLMGTNDGTLFTYGGLLDGTQRFKDGGIAKVQQFPVAPAHFLSSAPLSPSVLLAANMGVSNFGAQSAYRSDDGGLAWVKLQVRVNDDHKFINDANNAGWAGVAMVSDSEALGVLGRVIVDSTDGGKTWNTLAALDNYPWGSAQGQIPRFYAFDRRHAWGAISQTQLTRIGRQ